MAQVGLSVARVTPMVLKAEKRSTSWLRSPSKSSWPLVDDDHPFAERFDIGHVVAGEQHGRAVAPVVLGDESCGCGAAWSHPGRWSARRETAPWAVQQGADDLHLHALAQRQVAHRLVDQLLEVEQVDELVAGAGGIRRAGCRRSRAAARTNRRRAGPRRAGCGCPSPA